MIRSRDFWYGFSFLSGPITWAVHFMILYILGEFGCNSGFTTSPLRFSDGVDGGIIVVTVLALLVIGAGGWMAYQNGQARESSERQQFMALVGLGLNLLFGFAVIVAAIPVFFLSTCGSVTG